MMILGELTMLTGQKEVCGTVSYVPQESWLLPDTVRKNIIFDKEYDEDRYLQVLQACSLDEVIQMFKFIIHFWHHYIVIDYGQMCSSGLNCRFHDRWSPGHMAHDPWPPGT